MKTKPMRCRNTEFKGLSKSTIHAVMVENNHDYRKSKATLSEISSKSWRFSVSAFFRRKKPEPANSIPDARTIGCEELDGELRELTRDQIEAQIAEDCKCMRDDFHLCLRVIF